MSTPREVSHTKCFSGVLTEYEHDSLSTHTPMRFSIYRPRPDCPRPLTLFYLAGLTRDHMRFPESSVIGLKKASELGLALAFADTSPRNLQFPEFNARQEVGNAASFYLDATQSPWNSNFRMYTYLVQEWVPMVVEMLGADPGRKGIFGHSMGGHGAMMIALRNPDMFRSVSAFAPVGHPSASQLGAFAFEQYLGPDRSTWIPYDTTELIRLHTAPNLSIRVDLAGSDELADLLKNEDLEKVCAEVNRTNVDFRHHEGFMHGCYFVSSLAEEVLEYHYSILS